MMGSSINNNNKRFLPKMPDNNKHLLHVRSSQTETDGSPKLPAADRIEYGEIAVNFSAGKEVLSIKNSANQIVTFGDEVYIGEEAPAEGSHAEIFIDESVDPIEVEIYSKEQMDKQLAALTEKDNKLQADTDSKVVRGNEETNVTSNILIDESVDPVEVEIYTKGEIDTQVKSLTRTDTSLRSDLNQKVARGTEASSDVTDILIDTSASPAIEVYTKQQVDDMFAKLKQLNPSLVWN